MTRNFTGTTSVGMNMGGSADDKRIRKIVQEELKKTNKRQRFGMQEVPLHFHNGKDSPTIDGNNITPGLSVSGRISFENNDDYTIYLNSKFTPRHISVYGVAYSVTGTTTFNLATVDGSGNPLVWSAADSSVYTINDLYFTVNGTILDDTTLVTTSSFELPPSSGTLVRVSGSGDETIDYVSFSGGGTIGSRCLVVGSANLGPSFFLQPYSDRAVITGDIQYPFVDPNLDATVPLQSSSYLWVEGTSTYRALASEGHIVRVAIGSTIYASATIKDFSKDKITIGVQLADNWQIAANFVIT